MEWREVCGVREKSPPLSARKHRHLVHNEVAAGTAFQTIHFLPPRSVYVCAAFLMEWEKEWLGRGFQELILFLQKPPTEVWGT